MEGPYSSSEEALCGGGRKAAGAAHAGLPQLQVPASPEETAKTYLQESGSWLPPERAGSGTQHPAGAAGPLSPPRQR